MTQFTASLMANPAIQIITIVSAIITLGAFLVTVLRVLWRSGVLIVARKSKEAFDGFAFRHIMRSFEDVRHPSLVALTIAEFMGRIILALLLFSIFFATLAARPLSVLANGDASSQAALLTGRIIFSAALVCLFYALVSTINMIDYAGRTRRLFYELTSTRETDDTAEPESPTSPASQRGD